MTLSRSDRAPGLRVALLLPGLGRVQRGAETAFIELARGLSAFPDVTVDLFGSSTDYPAGLRVHAVPCISRERFERWPTGPVLRNEYCYEDLGFVASLAFRRVFKPEAFDVAVHCSFPFTNWFLQWSSRKHGPRSVFVTQNGDWPCRADSSEYRTFRCDGLICTNPEYYGRHSGDYNAALIPNGVDPDTFRPRATVPMFRRDDRLPTDKTVVLMASALVPYKRVADGVLAVANAPDAFLAVAGDGPEREIVREVAEREMPGRYALLGSVHRDQMADLYRQADVFLHMSQDEPFGIVYLEAAATGLPIVAHNAPITRWILGANAALVDTTALSAVADAVRRVSEAETAAALGTAAREAVLAEWTWAAQSAKYRDFLYSCAAITRQAAPV